MRHSDGLLRLVGAFFELGNTIYTPVYRVVLAARRTRLFDNFEKGERNVKDLEFFFFDDYGCVFPGVFWFFFEGAL